METRREASGVNEEHDWRYTGHLNWKNKCSRMDVLHHANI